MPYESAYNFVVSIVVAVTSTWTQKHIMDYKGYGIFRFKVTGAVLTEKGMI